MGRKRNKYKSWVYATKRTSARRKVKRLFHKRERQLRKEELKETTEFAKFVRNFRDMKEE